MDSALDRPLDELISERRKPKEHFKSLKKSSFNQRNYEKPYDKKYVEPHLSGLAHSQTVSLL